MTRITKIEWADAVWNPVVGCSKVSEGCRNCYAEAMAKRLKAMGRPEYQVVVDEKSWTGRGSLVEERLEDPYHWRRPRRIFVNSMSDLFHPGVPDAYIHRVFHVCHDNPRHTFMFLTKRPERMVDRVPIFPIENVWLGVSIENQKTADERIPLLLKTPGARRFVSYEPALGLIDIFRWIEPAVEDDQGNIYSPSGGPRLDWVICGGESGPNARPMHPDWARSVRDQCQAAGVPFFFKQWGEFHPAFESRNFEAVCSVCGCSDNDPCEGGCHWSTPEGEDDMLDRCSRCVKVKGHRWPDGTYSYRVGKQAAGRLFDGREWNEFPT